MPNRPPIGTRCPRGVWELPLANEAGERLAVAVDSHNRRVAELPFNERTEAGVRDRLWGMLEAADPVPALRLG